MQIEEIQFRTDRVWSAEKRIDRGRKKTPRAIGAKEYRHWRKGGDLGTEEKTTECLHSFTDQAQRNQILASVFSGLVELRTYPSALPLRSALATAPFKSGITARLNRELVAGFQVVGGQLVSLPSALPLGLLAATLTPESAGSDAAVLAPAGPKISVQITDKKAAMLRPLPFRR